MWSPCARPRRPGSRAATRRPLPAGRPALSTADGGRRLRRRRTAARPSCPLRGGRSRRGRRRRRLAAVKAAVVAVAIVLVAAGCGGEKPATAAPNGTVHGLIMHTGGPRGAAAVSTGGTVVVSRDGREVQHQDIAAGQQFSFSLAAGAYALTVRGVEGACGQE